MYKVENDVYIALGSNLGDREKNLLTAVSEVGKLVDTRITSLSPFYDTEPVGTGSEKYFLNAVMRLSTVLSPENLLHELMWIETSIFRRTRDIHWGPRSIDLDLLFYGKNIINNPPELQIPHPRLHQRRFVLAPLADIAPNFIHPLIGKSIGQLLAGLPPGSQVCRI